MAGKARQGGLSTGLWGGKKKLVLQSSAASIAIIYSHLRCLDMLVVQKASEVDSARQSAVGRGGDEITW